MNGGLLITPWYAVALSSKILGRLRFSWPKWYVSQVLISKAFRLLWWTKCHTIKLNSLMALGHLLNYLLQFWSSTLYPYCSLSWFQLTRAPRHDWKKAWNASSTSWTVVIPALRTVENWPQETLFNPVYVQYIYLYPRVWLRRSSLTRAMEEWRGRT